MNHSQNPDNSPDLDPTDLAKFQEMRLRRNSPKPDGRNAYDQLQKYMVSELSAYATNELQEVEDNSEWRRLLIERFDALLVAEKFVLKQPERHRLIEDVLGVVLESHENKLPDSQD